MNAEELKRKIKEIFGEQITFNKEFKTLAEDIKNVDENLINWCQRITERKIKPVTASVLGEKIVFIKKIGSSNRCIVIKIINGEFKEVHLGDHAYYDKLRKTLGLKKSS
jgi:hypothetical protein